MREPIEKDKQHIMRGGSLERKTGDDNSTKGARWQENWNARQEDEKQQKQIKRTCAEESAESADSTFLDK